LRWAESENKKGFAFKGKKGLHQKVGPAAQEAGGGYISTKNRGVNHVQQGGELVKGGLIRGRDHAHVKKKR